MHQSNQHVENLAFESTAVLWCVRSLLFFTLAFNDSNYHIRIEVCEITDISNCRAFLLQGITSSVNSKYTQF